MNESSGVFSEVSPNFFMSFTEQKQNFSTLIGLTVGSLSLV
jgi:hypothetical protein